MQLCSEQLFYQTVKLWETKKFSLVIHRKQGWEHILKEKWKKKEVNALEAAKGVQTALSISGEQTWLVFFLNYFSIPIPNVARQYFSGFHFKIHRSTYIWHRPSSSGIHEVQRLRVIFRMLGWIEQKNCLLKVCPFTWNTPGSAVLGELFWVVSI